MSVSVSGPKAQEPRPEKRVGLLAGNGQFPVLFSHAAKSKGMEVFAVAYQGQANEELALHVDCIQWLYMGEVERILRFFTENAITDVVMLGGIAKVQMFADLKLDAMAIEILSALKSTADDAVMRAFADFLEKKGLRVRPSTWLLPELLAPAGCWTKRGLTDQEAQDVAFGHDLAKKIGELDIGQCLVVAKGSVLAVEAIDGTDATIRRGGGLGNGNAVVIKICKPNQDRRFDLPSVGLETVRTMHESGAMALALDAGVSVVFDREEMVRFADSHGMAIVGV